MQHFYHILSYSSTDYNHIENKAYFFYFPQDAAETKSYFIFAFILQITIILIIYHEKTKNGRKKVVNSKEKKQKKEPIKQR